jgi:hypothetical protein|tara:strand:- start:377 stop:583 length:207 start_codon:yes stop_codon:yes gene_type:complete
MYKEILLKLELIECELDDATNQLPEYNANTDALGSIDCAKNELYDLKQLIEQKVLQEQKDHKELYNIK